MMLKSRRMTPWVSRESQKTPIQVLATSQPALNPVFLRTIVHWDQVHHYVHDQSICELLREPTAKTAFMEMLA